MSSLTRISPTVGDINFEFNDSCNCCCWKKPKLRPHPNTWVYVDSEGKVKNFDPKKSIDEMESMKRAVKNLKSKITDICEESDLDKKKVIKTIRSVSSLKLKGAEKIDLEKVNAVNQILRSEISRKS